MQTIYLDISNKGVIPKIHAKQGDVGRKFLAIITDNGTTISNFESPVFSVWYEGNSGAGNYSAIDGRPAVVFDGKNATVELATQMLTNAGDGEITLVMNDDMGYQIGIWNIEYSVEAVMGMGSQEVESYYTALSETASQAILAAERAEAAAKKFVVDDTLSKSGQAADAKAVGEKVKEINGQVANTEAKIKNINDKVNDVEDEIESLKSSVEPTVLWQNPAENDSFPAQTIELPNGANYHVWVVVFRHSTVFGYTQEITCEFSNSGVVYFPAYSAANNNLVETARMFIRRADRTGITFYEGYVSGSAENNGAVPIQILGLSELSAGGGGSGKDGDSAYEIAVKNGFEGTEEQWLDSLKGEPGKTPVKGTDYFTEADKAEMVDAVIAALPVYNGEVL